MNDNRPVVLFIDPAPSSREGEMAPGSQPTNWADPHVERFIEVSAQVLRRMRRAGTASSEEDGSTLA